MSYPRHADSTYVVAWDSHLIIKAGVTNCRRWRAFEIRGARLINIVAQSNPCLLEAELEAFIATMGARAFLHREEARAFLGGSGGGYMECSRYPTESLYRSAIDGCLSIMREHMLGAPARTDVTNGLTQNPTPDSDIRLVPNAHEIRATTGDGNG